MSSTKYVIIVFALMIACVAHAAQSSKRSFQTAYCMQYEQAQDTVDVETLLEKMEASENKELIALLLSHT